MVGPNKQDIDLPNRAVSQARRYSASIRSQQLRRASKRKLIQRLISNILILLRIVQYNVRSEVTKAVLPIFGSEEVKDVDIIAIQELPYSLFIYSFTNPGEGFYLAFEGDKTTRICFYVNRRLDVDSQDVTYYSGNLYILRITKKGDIIGDLSIHNIYNPPPVGREKPSTILLLKNILSAPGKYILFKDFNLYYYVQNEEGRAISYAESEDLLIVITKANLLLLIL